MLIWARCRATFSKVRAVTPIPFATLLTMIWHIAAGTDPAILPDAEYPEWLWQFNVSLTSTALPGIN
jgi:hypothetical protein